LKLRPSIIRVWNLKLLRIKIKLSCNSNLDLPYRSAAGKASNYVRSWHEIFAIAWEQPPLVHFNTQSISILHTIK